MHDAAIRCQIVNLEFPSLYPNMSHLTGVRRVGSEKDLQKDVDGLTSVESDLTRRFLYPAQHRNPLPMVSLAGAILLGKTLVLCQEFIRYQNKNDSTASAILVASNEPNFESLE